MLLQGCLRNANLNIFSSAVKDLALEDDLTTRLRSLEGDIPTPNEGLTEDEKDQLIVKVGGYLTAKNVVQAKKDYPLERIPFLFSSLDTQLVVDILNNDMVQALARSKGKRDKKKGG